MSHAATRPGFIAPVGTCRIAAALLIATGVLAISGCSPGPETTYGYSRGTSLNGIGAFAELLRERGHTVRTTYRLHEELEDWADVIVRFAPYPGPPEAKEAEWYDAWLKRGEGRSIVYVPRDFDTSAEYWADVLAHLPKSTPEDRRKQGEDLQRKAGNWYDHLPHQPKETAKPEDWFAVTAAATPPVVCKTLGGPWAEDLDPAQVALTRHEALKVESETVLLEGDGLPLALQWHRQEGRVLVVANGAFLLNAALLNPARRPLTDRVADWVDEPPRRVAFVEGGQVLGGKQGPPSVFELLMIAPFNWVAAQMLALGLVASLALAPRLGRPRPEPSSDADRPAAHPEALGALLAKTRQVADARAILEVYRRWRHSSTIHRPPAVSDDRPTGPGPPELPGVGPPALPEYNPYLPPVGHPESRA